MQTVSATCLSSGLFDRPEQLADGLHVQFCCDMFRRPGAESATQGQSATPDPCTPTMGLPTKDRAFQDMTEPSYCYRFGNAEFDEARNFLQIDNTEVRLEAKPRRILRLLLRSNGAVVTKEALSKALWNSRDGVSEQMLTNAIGKLRKALRGVEVVRVVSERGVGYRLDGPVASTVVAGFDCDALALTAGTPVPLRENFVLQSRFGASQNGNVWLSRHTKTGELRVFKFATRSSDLKVLKREVALWRTLSATVAPNDYFVKILDWNFKAPPFFLECQYGGDDLARWAEVEDRLRHLSLEDRLLLFQQLVDAVAVAHSAGVLHKDLKPANVLVGKLDDGTWRVRVADFGSGGLVDTTRLDTLGISRLGIASADLAVVEPTAGTLIYIAPEVVSGSPPTTQSDVFALGLMLYQIAIADFRRPLAPGWEQDVNDSLLREDIAAAMESNPSRRIPTGAELADRLRNRQARNLERQLRQANEQRAQLAEQRLAHVRMRRPWVTMAFLSLLVGLLVTLWQSHRERLAHEFADSVIDFNERVLAAINPINAGPTANEFSRSRLAQLTQQRDRYFSNSPESKASIDLSLSSVYFGIGDYSKAAELQRESLNLFAKTRGSGDVKTLTSGYALVRTLGIERQHDLARSILETMDRAAGNRLQKPSDLSLLAKWTRSGQAILEMLPAEALVDAEQADFIRRQIAADDEVWFVRTTSDLAWCYVRTQRSLQAARLLQQLMAPIYTPERLGIFDWARAHFEYGLALRNLRSEDSIRVMEDTLQHIEHALGEDHFLTAIAWEHVAAAYWNEGRWQPATEAIQRSYSIIQRTAGEHSQATLAVRGDVAALQYLSGRVNEALPVLQQTYAELLKSHGKDDPTAQKKGFYLASALLDAGKTEQAAAIASTLIAERLSAEDAGNDWVDRVAGLKGQILLAQGHREEARELLRDALSHLVKSQGPAWIASPLRKALDRADNSA
jgi:eukaryotic-like serine/threonine-protein kinase